MYGEGRVGHRSDCAEVSDHFQFFLTIIHQVLIVIGWDNSYIDYVVFLNTLYDLFVITSFTHMFA